MFLIREGLNKQHKANAEYIVNREILPR